MVAGMVEVRLLPEEAVVLVRPGTTLLEAFRLCGRDVATGCERGMCGTDAVRIAEGADNLAAPADHEQGTLERMGLEDGFRLSCSARVVAGTVRVETGAF